MTEYGATGRKLVDDATTPHEIQQIGGFQMEVRPETTDVPQTKIVLEGGEYAKRVTFTPSDIWLDIGGNIGSFALQAAARSGGRVHSFEPDPHNFQVLMNNVQRNGLSYSPTTDRGISVYAAAISDQHGETVTLYRNRHKGKGRHSILEVSGRDPLEVGNFHVNRVIGSLGVNKIKIDAEGAELLLIAAIDPTLWPGIQEIVLEYHFQALKDTTKEKYRWLIEMLQVYFPHVQFRQPNSFDKNWTVIVSAHR